MTLSVFMVYAGQMAAADVPTMTNSTWRMLRLAYKYAVLFMVYAGQMAAADVPTMTNSSWRMLRLTCEYADLMRGLRAEAGKVFSGLCEMFEMYLLHVFHNFSDVSLAELVSPHQQQQQVGIINAGSDICSCYD